jgi:hypothetical protein
LSEKGVGIPEALNLKTAVGYSDFATTSCIAKPFPHPNPLPKEEGVFALLPVGEGSGMRGRDMCIMR